MTGLTTRATDKRTVAGLEVTEWAGSGQVVFGLPGLGSSGSSWRPLAESLPEARVLSVDLRGRGAGMGMSGPAGLRGHAQDVARVMAELDLTDVIVVGHSMGAFLAPVVYQEAPGRVAKLVLVDGGVQPAFPFFMGPRVTRLMFGKQLRPMTKPWPDAEAIARKGKMDKMLAGRPDLRPAVMQMIEDQMVGSSIGFDAPRLIDDAVDTFWGPDREALSDVTVPVELVLAEHAKNTNGKPFIADKAVTPWTAKMPNLSVRRLKGNHITVVFESEVAAACTL